MGPGGGGGCAVQPECNGLQSAKAAMLLLIAVRSSVSGKMGTRKRGLQSGRNSELSFYVFLSLDKNSCCVL